MGRPSIASSSNAASCEREYDINVTFTGAGTAVMTAVKTRGLAVGASTGVGTKNTRQGVGQYTLYVDPNNIPGAVAGFRGMVHTAATTAPLFGKYVPNSLNRTTGAFQVEFWVLSATPALTDPPAGSFVDLCIQFYDNVVSP